MQKVRSPLRGRVTRPPLLLLSNKKRQLHVGASIKEKKEATRRVAQECTKRKRKKRRLGRPITEEREKGEKNSRLFVEKFIFPRSPLVFPLFLLPLSLDSYFSAFFLFLSSQSLSRGHRHPHRSSLSHSPGKIFLSCGHVLFCLYPSSLTLLRLSICQSH